MVQSRSKLYRTDFLRPSPFPYTQHFTLEANVIQWLLIQQLVITGWGRIYVYALTISIQVPTFRIFQGCPYQYITYSHQVSPHSGSPFPVPRIGREVRQHYPAERAHFFRVEAGTVGDVKTQQIFWRVKQAAKPLTL